MLAIDFLAILDLEATSAQELLCLVSNHLEAEGYVQPSFCTALLEREQKYPTGLPAAGCSGIAMPHVDAVHVKKSAILTVRLQRPVTFGMMGGTPEQTVEACCLFVLLFNECNEHLKALAHFIRVIQHADDMAVILTTPDPYQIEQLLTKHIQS